MRVAAIMNTINRYGITPTCTEENIARAGMDFDLFITDNGSSDKRIVEWGKRVAHKHTANETNMGNPYALNRMIKDALEYDYIVILGNDILLPSNWLIHALTALQVHNVGMVGWMLEGKKHLSRFFKDGVEFEIDESNVVIGSTVMRREVIDKIGYLNEFSKFGHWDATFSMRVSRHFDCFYMARERAKHIGVAPGEFEYKDMKRYEAQKAFVKAWDWHSKYQQKDVYLDIEQNVHLG